MFGLSEDFERLHRENKEIRVSIIGVGQMGRALVAQMVKMKGINPVVIVDHRAERIVKVLEEIGCTSYERVNSLEEAEAVIESGKLAIAEDDSIATASRFVEVVIDATGSTEGSAKIALSAIENKKHIVLMTVETDVTVGAILRKKAEKNGVMLTGMAGDEPGAVMELYDFAKTMGLDVLVLGKGKNNPVNYSANPDSAREEAIGKEMNPYMLASFQDCSKTMIELCAISNATGFLPDKIGCHGKKADTKTMLDVYCTKKEGGILDGYGVVDYVEGIAPGVFAIVTTKNEELKKELKYLSMGDGPNYLLYRPYHLCSFEVPITVGRMVLYNRSSLNYCRQKPYSEVVAFAKRDLHKGESLDRIGGYTVYGVITAEEDTRKNDYLPVGLVNENTVMRNDVKMGEPIRYSDVVLDESSVLVSLRREQDELVYND